MGREFGLGRAQQPDLSRDLAGQGLERDRGVVAIQVKGSFRGGTPLGGAFPALLVA
jgi:hypothetical protein